MDADTTLYCATCQMEISGIGPRASRALKGYRPQSPHKAKDTIVEKLMRTIHLAYSGAVREAHRRVVARELARNVTCTIHVWTESGGAGDWIPAITGRSHLNTDAGDTYARKAGALAALRNALPREPADFKRPATQDEEAEMMAGPDREALLQRYARQRFRAAAMAAYLDRKSAGRAA